MGIRYGKLDKGNRFAGIIKERRLEPRPVGAGNSRDARIKRGDDAFTESLAGIEREDEMYEGKEEFWKGFDELHDNVERG